MFIEKYIGTLSSSDLRDDEHHHATEPLFASAVADQGSGAIDGSMLCRAKYAGTPHKAFESGCAETGSLLKMWKNVVKQRGIERKWVPMNAAWDVESALKIFDVIAELSLAHWLDPNCLMCRGTKITKEHRACPCCNGSGQSTIDGGRFISDKARDMVGELEGAFQSYQERAARKMRRAA